MALINLDIELSENEILETKQVADLRIKELGGFQNNFCSHSVPM